MAKYLYVLLNSECTGQVMYALAKSICIGQIIYFRPNCVCSGQIMCLLAKLCFHWSKCVCIGQILYALAKHCTQWPNSVCNCQILYIHWPNYVCTGQTYHCTIVLKRRMTRITQACLRWVPYIENMLICMQCIRHCWRENAKNRNELCL